MSLAASRNFLPRRSRRERVGFTAFFGLLSVSSSAFSALRSSLACFSSASFTALALRLPAFAVVFSSVITVCSGAASATSSASVVLASSVIMVTPFVVRTAFKPPTIQINLSFDFNTHAAGGASNHFLDGFNVVGVHVFRLFFGDGGQVCLAQFFGNFFA